MRVICGRNEAVTAAAAKYGWQSAETDWRAVIARDDIDIIDVCTPGSSHEEIAVAALNAGKHVICEKPLANTVAEAERMAAAARASSGKSMVAFNYRRVPALAYARELVRQGDSAAFFMCELCTSRTDHRSEFPGLAPGEGRSGVGCVGPGAHIVDAAQFVTESQITNVGELRTFIDERPLVSAPSGGDEERGTRQGHGGRRGPVPRRISITAPWRVRNNPVCQQRKNGMAIEVNGEKASLRFEFESMNELWVHDHTVDGKDGSCVMVTESDHPYVEVGGLQATCSATTPSPMNSEISSSTSSTTAHRPSFADSLHVQQFDAVERSAQAQSVRTNV